MRMKAALELLPAERFLRVHRSYIVDLQKVTRISSDQVALGEIVLPIGETYASAVRGYFRWDRRG